MLSPHALIFLDPVLHGAAGAAALALFPSSRLHVDDAGNGVLAWTVTGAATGFLFLLHARDAGLVAAFVLLAASRVRRASPPHAAALRRRRRGPAEQESGRS